VLSFCSRQFPYSPGLSGKYVSTWLGEPASAACGGSRAAGERLGTLIAEQYASPIPILRRQGERQSPSPTQLLANDLVPSAPSSQKTRSHFDSIFGIKKAIYVLTKSCMGGIICMDMYDRSWQ